MKTFFGVFFLLVGGLSMLASVICGVAVATDMGSRDLVLTITAIFVGIGGLICWGGYALFKSSRGSTGSPRTGWLTTSPAVTPEPIAPSPATGPGPETQGTGSEGAQGCESSSDSSGSSSD